MCDIYGVVYNDRSFPVDKSMLYRMTEIIRHRGPDSHGFHIASDVGLGVR